MKSLLCCGLIFAVGCAGVAERQTRSDFDEYVRSVRSRGEPPKLDGSFDAYVLYAMHQSPELRADFERWRAAQAQIAVASKLPEPQVSFAYFIQSVETRVGPQRFKLGIRQMIPWPGVLTAAANAAALRARVAEAKLESRALEVRREVAAVYWQLWLVEKEHALMVEQEALLGSMNELVRGRMETGKADLADAAQASLRLEKLKDHHARHQEMRKALQERLRAVIDAPADADLPISPAAPGNELPRDDELALTTAALTHPDVERFERMAAAAEAQADLEAAKGLPSFGLGFEWIETGPAAVNIPDSGKDPLIVSLTVTLPIWFGAYSSAREAALAEAAAIRADQEAFELKVRRDVAKRVSDVRDAARRVALHRDVLVPHATTAWESTLGSYAVGRAGIAEVLSAQRELIEHQVALEQARIEHARAWAELEELVGRELEALPEPAASDAAPSDAPTPDAAPSGGASSGATPAASTSSSQAAPSKTAPSPKKAQPTKKAAPKAAAPSPTSHDSHVHP